MRAAYRADRRSRAEGALGGPRRPTSGILPGRALAVFLLRILLVPRGRAMESEDNTVKRRACVDDL
eukprot:11210463-Lingulodinium_polyedra.AAC.1